MAAELRPEHFSDFMRLVKSVRYGNRSQVLVAEFDEGAYRDGLMSRIDVVATESNLRTGRLALSAAQFQDFDQVERVLIELSHTLEVVQVTGGERWFDRDRWEAFNVRREAVTRGAPVRLLLWLTEQPIALFALAAPDLWSWRSGVFCFRSGLRVVDRTLPSSTVLRRSLPEATRRISELRAWLSSDPIPDDEVRGALLNELSTLLTNIGELDEALRIRREEELPVYEKLGDVRSRAITLGKIADILQARGELDEALRIWETQIPVFERLGDAPSLNFARQRIESLNSQIRQGGRGEPRRSREA